MPGGLPSGSDPSQITPWDYSIVGAGFSDLALRTETNVRAAKDAEVKNGTLKDWSDEIFANLDASLGLHGGIIKAILERVIGSTPLGTSVLDLLDDLDTWFTRVRSFLADINFLDPSFDLTAAATDFTNLIIGPTGLFATLVGGFIQALQIPGLDASKIVSGQFAQEQIDGLREGLLELHYAIQQTILDFVNGDHWQQLLDTIWQAMFGGGTTGHGVTDVLTAMQNIPGLNIVSSILASIIPGLDTSKITTGTFPNSFIPGLISLLNALFGTNNILSNILASIIPGLDTSKITTGTFTNSFLPGLVSLLNALFGTNNILSNILATIVPGLDASKITSGQFPQTQTTNLVSDLLAKLGVNVFNAAAQAGPNTVLGPSYDDSTIARNYSSGAGGGYSTEQKHSGTQSFKIVSQGGWDELDLIPIAGGTSVQDKSKSLKVVPGQKWFISAWCYAKSTNAGTNKAALDALFTDSSGVNSDNYNVVNGVLTTVTVNTWTQISGYITVPAGYDRMLPYFFTDNPTTVGNIWYVDDTEVYQDVTPARSSGIQDIINSVTNFLQGLTGSAWGQAQANTALAATKLSMDQMAAQIQALSASKGGSDNSGVSVVVNYNDYANGSLPATHTLVTDGTNTSTIGITSGRVHVNKVNNGDYKDFEVIYNAKQTNTDYQLVGITLTTMMESGFGSTATNWIKARMNTAQTRYIYVAFHKDDFNNLYFRLVAVTASGGIVWKDWTAMPWAQTGWLECGTTGGSRIYRVWAGNQIVWTHTEVGTLSDLGASNRSCGFGAEALPTIGGALAPGDMSQFAFYDNTPPTTVGITASHYRNSTTGSGTGGTGDREVPASIFDTALRITPGITLVNGKSYQVAEAGTYRFQFCLHNVAGMVTSNVEPLLYVTPSGGASAIRKRGGHQYFDGSTHTRLHGDFSVYLNAGDAVTPGIGSPSFTWSIAGEATGSFTWMSISLENKNTN